MPGMRRLKGLAALAWRRVEACQAMPRYPSRVPPLFPTLGRKLCMSVEKSQDGISQLSLIRRVRLPDLSDLWRETIGLQSAQA